MHERTSGQPGTHEPSPLPHEPVFNGYIAGCDDNNEQRRHATETCCIDKTPTTEVRGGGSDLPSPPLLPLSLPLRE